MFKYSEKAFKKMCNLRKAQVTYNFILKNISFLENSLDENFLKKIKLFLCELEKIIIWSNNTPENNNLIPLLIFEENKYLELNLNSYKAVNNKRVCLIIKGFVNTILSDLAGTFNYIVNVQGDSFINVNKYFLNLLTNSCSNHIKNKVLIFLNHFLSELEEILKITPRDYDVICKNKEEALVNNQTIQMDSVVDKGTKIPLIFVLVNLRSAFNVGSIFRTAECLGVSRVFTVGYTAKANHPVVYKCSMGTSLLVETNHFDNNDMAIQSLRDNNTCLVAAELSSDASILNTYKFKKNTAIFFGNEQYGLEPLLLNQIEEIIYIPMQGKKNSLNVGVTAGIIGAEASRQWSL